ncbi:hypothetical protein MUO14_13270 [Halobacillus shinanisalinarum]|uniref:Uncharacterized protein n=1 Tax=Halobacillus shinanisalinarum TaxID=2932258 RepID=A0ABY4GU48_9BACI|nr:hypothetical protein [Halobacillus shinanisalinarum]UOQ91549.1 hypothetical protein MUO14_13270 [Halobacillus shinanisalinarum]
MFICAYVSYAFLASRLQFKPTSSAVMNFVIDQANELGASETDMMGIRRCYLGQQNY